MNGLKTLPDTFSNDNFEPWEYFFTTFGTHITSKVIMGGHAYQLISMGALDYRNLTSLNIDIKEQLHIFFGLFTATASQDEKESLDKRFEISISDAQAGCQGGDASICAAANFSYCFV